MNMCFPLQPQQQQHRFCWNFAGEKHCFFWQHSWFYIVAHERSRGLTFFVSLENQWIPIGFIDNVENCKTSRAKSIVSHQGNFDKIDIFVAVAAAASTCAFRPGICSVWQVFFKRWRGLWQSLKKRVKRYKSQVEMNMCLPLQPQQEKHRCCLNFPSEKQCFFTSSCFSKVSGGQDRLLAAATARKTCQIRMIF